MDAEVEGRLFKAAVASSGARLCGWKCLHVAKNCKKITPWWNLEVEDTIRAKKVACKA